MPVMVKIHAFKPVTFGIVIDMPKPNILVVQTNHGTVTVHESLIRKYL